MKIYQIKQSRTKAEPIKGINCAEVRQGKKYAQFLEYQLEKGDTKAILHS